MERSYEFDPAPSWLARFYHTPVGDALRGHLSGRLDVRREVAAAALPRPIAGLIYAVVRRTRLWRREKSDVARELVAHFADGLSSGRAPDELLRDFGSPEKAAKLIRQAKRRGRPHYWQVWWYVSRTLLALILVSVVGYALLAARFYLARPTIAHNYWDAINAPRTVPEAERAWPLYRAAMVKLGRSDAEILTGDWPGDKNWPNVAAIVERHRESIELARAAAAKPHMGSLLGDPDDRVAEEGWIFRSDAPIAADNPPVWSATLPSADALRQLAFLLGADARRAAAAGDGATVLADLSALLSMSEQTFQPHVTLVEQLVGCAIFTMATENIRGILAAFPDVLSDAQLRDLAHRIAAYRGGDIGVDFSGERLAFDDLLQRVYTDDGGGDGRLTDQGLEMLSDLLDFETRPRQRVPWEKLLGPGMAAMVGSRGENRALFNSHLDEMIALHGGPAWQWDHDAIEAAEDRLGRKLTSGTGRIRYLFAGLFLPALPSVFSVAQRTIQERDATEAAIALVLWHRQHGDWPQSLDPLVPDRLPAVPTDRYDGRPLRYVVRDGQPLLYSIGYDRDDDGGQPTESVFVYYDGLSPETVKRRRQRGISTQGDWVFFPPPREAEEQESSE